MKRPYLQFTVAQLEEMYERSKSEPAALKKLVTELRHRQVPKARALLQEVHVSLEALSQGSTGADSAPGGQTPAPAPPPAAAPAPALVTSAVPAPPLALGNEQTTAWPQTTVSTLTPPEPIRQASVQAERLRAASAGVPAPARHANPPAMAEAPAVPNVVPTTREPPKQEPISDEAPMTVELACKLLKVTATDAWERIETQRRHMLANTSPLSLRHASGEKSAQEATRAARINEAYVVLAALRVAK